MNYEEALKYIHGVSWTFCKPGLDRIEELCGALGHPEKELKFVHVAGTNGKGSFCSMLESILRNAGYKTGLYTSPYIKEFNERMRVMGENIDNATLARITERVRPVADSMKDKPTEFELITAIAFEYFKESGCEVVVLEAGMGGRLDSTNVIRNPLLSVITGIALDHTAFLGDTTEKIAKEKAGIIKDGAPVLYGGVDDGAARVIEEVANKLGSEYTRVDYGNLSVRSATLDGTLFDFGNYKNVNISLLGLYQPRNASVVLSAVDILRKRGLEISDEAVRKGLKDAKWPARFEVVCDTPLIIFDGAHNPDGITSATRSIRHYFGERGVFVLTGVLKDKDYDFIAGELATVAKRAFTLTPDSPRALSAEEYSEVLKLKGVDATPYPTISEAFLAAKDAAARTGMPLVCLGSLYTYVDLSRYF